MKQELAYWMALAHLPKLTTKLKNELIVKIFYDKKTIIEFFQFDSEILKNKYLLNDNEIELLEESKKQLPNYAFMVEDLLEQGYDIIPINSEDYPTTLKNNLKRTYSPPLIYSKGNKQLFKEKSVAIVGSRDASEISLNFTDKIALEASKNFKVVVSGFAKGVDKQALDSSLKYIGQSIIVLPQGIMTFDSGFKKYHKQIVDGNVIVLSTFFPKAPWSVKLAMARNPIIYGLAEEIYVAESSEKGGTWSGVIDGLRKGRKIYVRKPELNEPNANNILIEKGALPVDSLGKLIEPVLYEEQNEDIRFISEPQKNLSNNIIYDLLIHGEYSSKEIIRKLKLEMDSKKLTKMLKEDQEVKTIDGKPIKFTMKSNEDLSLF